MNLKEKRAAALKGARDLAEAAKSASRSMTTEELAQANTFLETVKECDSLIKAATESDSVMQELASLAGSSVETPESKGGSERQAKSLGDHFVKSLQAAGRSLKEPGTFHAPEFKAATDDQVAGGHEGAYGPLLTDIDRNFVLPKRERLVVADLLQSGAVSGTAITYPVFGALEGGTGMVAEGGQKPQMHVADPDWRTDALSEVAGWFKMTDDMAEDLAYVVSEINSTALYDLAYREEQQLLNGDGTGQNLTGILQRSGVQAHAQGADSVADAIFKATSLVQTATGFTADAVVINPQDYEPLRLAKDGNDQYYGGGYFVGQYGNGAIMENPPIWGRRTVVTPAIAAGTVLVGAFNSAKVFRKGGIRVESTNSHEDDFTNDKITTRVRERVGLQVKYPAAFVAVELGAAEPTP